MGIRVKNILWISMSFRANCRTLQMAINKATQGKRILINYQQHAFRMLSTVNKIKLLRFFCRRPGLLNCSPATAVNWIGTNLFVPAEINQRHAYSFINIILAHTRGHSCRTLEICGHFYDSFYHRLYKFLCPLLGRVRAWEVFGDLIFILKALNTNFTYHFNFWPFFIHRIDWNWTLLSGNLFLNNPFR